MLALRRARMAASPPFLRGGFRPFFFGGAVWAVIVLALWMKLLLYGGALPTAFDPMSWHRHEMLFGFVGAIIAGFLLTAIPNWTGRLPIAGPPLALLFLLWIAGRLAVLFSGRVGALPAAAIDVAFYIVLAAVAGREVIAAKNRNLPAVVLLLLFGIANATDHAAVAGWLFDNGIGVRAGIALAVLMISVIGGRIIPSFTRNWMTKRGIRQGLPDQPARYDRATVTVNAIALAVWTGFPEARGSAWLLFVAAAMQAVRLARWRGWKTLADPLVVVLHIGYAWLPAGLTLLGLAVLIGAPTVSVAMHALTAGGMATMILAVMTRASLGHTGRPLHSGAATTAIYVLVTLGALLRVLGPLVLTEPSVSLELAALMWGAAFALFAVVYGRILFAARVDDPAG